MTAPPSPTPLTVQELIDRSSHCMVVDGAGTPHSAVKAKISDLRLIQVQLSESQEKLREAETLLLQAYNEVAAADKERKAAEAALAAAVERCAKVCDDIAAKGGEGDCAAHCAQAIRALAAPQEERGQ